MLGTEQVAFMKQIVDGRFFKGIIWTRITDYLAFFMMWIACVMLEDLLLFIFLMKDVIADK
jgi:hypothetical protein